MTDYSFEETADRIWSFTSPNGPTSAVIAGGDGLVVVDGQPTAALAGALAAETAALRAGPVRYLVLTHFHAARWANLSVFGDPPLITTRKCRNMLVHRGADEAAMAPMQGVEVFGPPRPVTMAFKTGLSLFLDERQIDVLHFGKAHTQGDAVVWVPDAGTMITGDVVERGVAPYLADGSFDDWVSVIDILRQYRPRALIPGRGAPAQGREAAQGALMETRYFVSEAARIGGAAAREGTVPDVARALEKAASGDWATLPLWSERLPFAAARIHEAATGGAIPGHWTEERLKAVIAEIS